MVTSYEIVWATARRAPNIEYLEFDAQPDHRIEYTERLDVAKINSMPMLRFSSGCGIGRGIHNDNARNSDRVGAIINKVADVFSGRRGSLMKSFMASAKGCRIPYGPTMLGPLRSCI